MCKGPKQGKPEREAPPGKGRGPQEATLKKARCPQLWTFSSRPPGLGKRRKREGRKDLGESFHGGLCVKRLVRMNTRPAHPPLGPGPQGPVTERPLYQGLLGYPRPSSDTATPGKSGKAMPLPSEEERSWGPTAMKLLTLEFERNANTVSFNQESVRKATHNKASVLCCSPRNLASDATAQVGGVFPYMRNESRCCRWTHTLIPTLKFPFPSPPPSQRSDYC